MVTGVVKFAIVFILCYVVLYDISFITVLWSIGYVLDRGRLCAIPLNT